MFIKVFLVLVGLMLCKGNPRILVNNMTLPDKMEVEYTFNDGDLVDVMCALSKKVPKCKLKMEYNFTRNYPVPELIKNKYSQYTAKDPVGFQLRMGAVNNNTHAICTCQHESNSVRVNFHMKKEGDTPIEDKEKTPIEVYETNNGCNMKAELKYWNGSIATPSLRLYEAKNLYYIYEYQEDANFNFTCSVHCNRKFQIHFDPAGTSEGKDKKDIPSFKATDAKMIDKPAIERDKVFKCYVIEIDKREHFMSRTIVFVPYIPPTTITSTTTTKSTSTPITTNAGTGSSNEALNGDQDMNGDGSPPSNWHKTWSLVAIVIVALIVIICVSVVIYKMKNRKNDHQKPQTQPSAINYENLDSNDSPIPPFPPQWDSHYATPADQIAEPTYSEPCIGARANTKNELYTTAIPKSRRKPANNQIPTYEDISTHRPTQQTLDDPNYAEIVPQNALKNELNLMYAKVQPKSQRNKNDYVNVGNSPYAEVVPKSMRKEGGREGGGKYENVHTGRYVNVKSDGEYAEPAYCEPSYLNKK